VTIVLRPWQLSDAEWYAAATDDDDIQQFTNEGDVDPEKVREALRRLEGTAGMFAIADERTGDAIGNIGWKPLADVGVVEGYYWVAAEARRSGVATAALEELWARAVASGIRSMRLVIDVDNVGSRRTAARAGFREVGPGTAREHAGGARETVVYERDS